MHRSQVGTVRTLAVLCAAVFALTFASVGTAGAAKDKAKTVKVAKVPGVGAVLVDAEGKVLYTLTDASGAAVECTGGCATAWPPLTVAAGAKAKAGKGVAKVAATSDGQVTANGLPLYRFAGDAAPKEANGDGLVSFGGTWKVVKAKANAKATTTKSGSSTTSGGGYSGY